MQAFTTIEQCRLCGSTELHPVLSLGSQCLTGVFPRSADEVVTEGPLTLVRCAGGPASCGLVQLLHSYDATEMYGPTYGYRSSLNASMVEHLGNKIARLSELAGLRAGDVVLDIGSNDGTSLSFYPGEVVRFGMDPTAAKFREHYPDNVQVISDFFSSGTFDRVSGGCKAKIVTSIAMLYDLADPLGFAREVESVMEDDGIWHFEQSYLPSMLSTSSYDTICHEHVEYYSLAQIEWIIERAGLEIIDVELNEVNGGSFAVTACKTGRSIYRRSDRVASARNAEQRLGLRDSLPYSRFAKRVAQHKTMLTELLCGLKSEHQLVLGYGASTKGNVILQYCGIGTELIPCFAEINSDKFGSFTPGSRIPIVSEREARGMRPDYFLVMPWHFRNNLIAREAEYLARGGRMIFPLPAVEIVGGPAT